MKLTETEKQLLIGFFTLKTHGNAITLRNFIRLSKDYFLFFTRSMDKYSNALTLLLEKSLISVENKNISLTDEGNSRALTLALERPKMWYWYNDYFQRTFESRAHKRFRKQMFGKKGIHSHSSTSLNQIKAIIDDLSLHSGKTILELGCGDGSVAEYIHDKTGAAIHGIDNSPIAIKQALNRTAEKRDKLKYHLMDMNHLEMENIVFDGIYSIDALYFADIKTVLEKCYTMVKNSGFIVILYTAVLQDGEAHENLFPENTALGKILTEHDKQFFVREFTGEVIDFVYKSKEVALKLKDEFISENNEALFNDIIKNFNEVTQWQKHDTMKRYLYRITV